ncbi:MAG: GDP-mannose 4,6-dehydratase, partial [Candidatus Hydrogenedentes bacterium]|nr:GDP-mannose 4,6-dehydratase [Candidatus Hydrogenedentota bacterium]
ITIYGDGKQVRDVLYVDDLVDAYLAAEAQKKRVVGKIYNVGGGAERTLSVWAELGPILEEALGKRIPVTFSDWRPGDQRVYVSDVRKIAAELGWQPKTRVREGVIKLIEWVRANRTLFV